MRKKIACSLLPFLFLLGCETGGSRTPKTEFISQGSGDTSLLPLHTLTPGARRDGVTRVLGPGRGFDTDVIRSHNGDNMRFYNVRDDGLYYEGSQTGGLLARSELILPSQLRLGMKWHVYQEAKEPAREYEVVAVEQSGTIQGQLSLWRIESRELIASKNVFETTYAEGLGPYIIDGHTLRENIEPRTPLSATWPSDAPLSLEDGKEVMTELWGQLVTGVVSPSGELTMRLAGQIPAFTNDGWNARWGLEPRLWCVHEDGSSDPADLSTCRDAMATLFHNGQAKGTIVGMFGESARDGFTPVVNTRNEYQHIGIPNDPYFAPNFTIGIPAQVEIGSGHTSGGNLTAGWSGVGGIQRILMTQAGPTDNPRFVLYSGQGMLLHGAINGRDFRPLSLIGSTGSRLTGVLEGNERTILFASPDGLVDRLIIEDSSARLVRYARLNVPAGHEVFGVIPRRDHLIVYATKGRNPLLLRVPGKPEVGSVYMFRAALPTPSSEPVASSDLIVQQNERDIEVCARPGTHPSAEGWTLGGRPTAALASRPDGSCVLLLRDASQKENIGMPWYVDGPLGALAFTSNTNIMAADFIKFERYAAVKGGFMTVDKLYGAAGTPYGPPIGGQFGVDGQMGPRTPDPFGHGLWWQHSQYPNDVITHIGPNKTHETTVPTGGLVIGYIEGGGIIREDGTGIKLWHPDDRVTAVDTTGLPGRIHVAMADGTLCGFNYTTSTIWCRDVDGTMRISGVEAWANGDWWPLGNGRIFHHIYARLDIVGQILDPKTLAISDVSAAPLSQLYPGTYFDAKKFRSSPSGELFMYMATNFNNDPRVILHLALDGTIHPVSLPGIEPAELRDFAVGDKVLLIATPRGLIRLKR